MPRLFRMLCVALLCSLHALSVAASEPPALRWQFSEGVLAMWGLEVETLDPDDPPALTDAEQLGYRGWRSPLRAGPLDREFVLPGLRLRRGGHELLLREVRLRLDPAQASVLIADQDGRPWLIADMAHQMPGAALDWRHLTLRPLPAAARALGEPALEHAVLGALALSGGPSPAAAKGSNQCVAGDKWPSPEQPADIALTSLGMVAAFDSRDCSSGSCIIPSPAGSLAGEVVVAPDALLVNVGDRDVPWIEKFRPAAPPYGNDQHPYLVWAMYRQDADGELVPLGSSGVKHAFFAQNSGCPCNGAYVLYPGCGDLYSASTNDLASALGPRNEIDPRSGQWGRCGSVFDPDCNGVQNVAGFAQRFQRRLLAAESDMLASEHPGARWFIEGWYVVRDDGNLDNSMAHREILPAKQGTGWVFPTAGGLQPGPLISRWVDPAAPTPQRQAQRLDLADGRLQLAVQVDAVGSCRFRYRYALMNLDYAHSSFSGSPPNLRMESTRGVQGLGWSVDLADIQQLRFRDDDRVAETDWSAGGAGPLQLVAPTGGDLGWGRLATVSFESQHAPTAGTVTVQLGDGGSAGFSLLVPTPGGRAFCDGFE